MMRLIFLFIISFLTISSRADVKLSAELLDGSFNAENNQRPLSIVEWRTSNNVQADCEAESKQRKLEGFNYDLAACSFWKDDFCVIITSKNPTTVEVGHELRHCFQGNFH